MIELILIGISIYTGIAILVKIDKLVDDYDKTKRTEQKIIELFRKVQRSTSTNDRGQPNFIPFTKEGYKRFLQLLSEAKQGK